MGTNGKLVVVGVGGIGSHLLLPLFQFLTQEDMKERYDCILLVDGDDYEDKNKKRQFVPEVGENKALATANYYNPSFPELTILSDPRYVTEENIEEIISEKDVVLLCVDNNATRKLFEDYLDKLDNFLLISGGNELYDGNVIIVSKRNGSYITPKMTELHPEIGNGLDKNPTDLSCEELAQSMPQISLVNAAVSDAIRRAFAAYNYNGINYNEVYLNILRGSIRNVMGQNNIFYSQ